MLQLANKTPLSALLYALADEDGVDSLFVCVKASWTLDPVPTLCAEQDAIQETDGYRAEPGASSLSAHGEIHTGNAGTDVVLFGHAWAPNGSPVTHTAVSVAVAERRSVVAVYGDRTWSRRGRITRPKPFTIMPLVYERAFGGPDDPANPVGVGRRHEPGDPLPNLEDPGALIAGPDDAPAPHGLGPIAPHWEPRRSRAGTYDARWKRSRAPLLPADFDAGFFSVAPPALAFDRVLEGGEPVEIVGACPGGPMAFELPRVRILTAARVAGAVERSAARLESVVLRPDDRRLTMTWRAKYACDRALLSVDTVAVDWEEPKCAA